MRAFAGVNMRAHQAFREVQKEQSPFDHIVDFNASLRLTQKSHLSVVFASDF
jgi:hypothetical protein